MKLLPRKLLMIVAAAVLIMPSAYADGWRGGQGGGQQGGGFNRGGHDDHGGRDDHRGGRDDHRGGDWGRGGGHGGGHGGGWGPGPGHGGPGFPPPGHGGGFPPPYPVQQQTMINCSSFNYQFNNCMINANIISVQLVNQRSMASCVLGQSWGYQGNSVWVSQGCQADFVVYYRY